MFVDRTILWFECVLRYIFINLSTDHMLCKNTRTTLLHGAAAILHSMWWAYAQKIGASVTHDQGIEITLHGDVNNTRAATFFFFNLRVFIKE